MVRGRAAPSPGKAQERSAPWSPPGQLSRFCYLGVLLGWPVRGWASPAGAPGCPPLPPWAWPHWALNVAFSQRSGRRLEGWGQGGFPGRDGGVWLDWLGLLLWDPKEKEGALWAGCPVPMGPGPLPCPSISGPPLLFLSHFLISLPLPPPPLHPLAPPQRSWAALPAPQTVWNSLDALTLACTGWQGGSLLGNSYAKLHYKFPGCLSCRGTTKHCSAYSTVFLPSLFALQ